LLLSKEHSFIVEIVKAHDDKLLATFTPDDAKILQRGTQGVTFRILRKQADLTLDEVSKALAEAGDPLSTAMISLFERGKKDLRLATLERLEKIYGVPASKENAEQRAMAIALPFLRHLNKATEEPRAKTAKQRELQDLRREMNALRYELETVKLQLKGRDTLLAAQKQYIEKLEDLLRDRSRRRAFYGET